MCCEDKTWGENFSTVNIKYIGMQRVQELFLLDGWVEVGQFVLLMFSIFKEKEYNFQTNQNIALLYLHLRKKITKKCSIL